LLLSNAPQLKTLHLTWGFMQAPSDEYLSTFYQVQLSTNPSSGMGLHKALPLDKFYTNFFIFNLGNPHFIL